MVISDFAIKRPMITVVTMVALVVFGLFALWRLQTDEFPDIQQPVVLTLIPYPGASPEGVEREILKPVEDAIKGISLDRILDWLEDLSLNALGRCTGIRNKSQHDRLLNVRELVSLQTPEREQSEYHQRHHGDDGDHWTLDGKI